MSRKNKGPIGVFDSGVGGLSVLRQLKKDFPGESFIYLGDTARLPYGTKSSETITNYAQKNLNFLLDNFNIKALVVACNSVSTVIDKIHSPVPLFGVIKPGARAAVETLTDDKRIGLWATQATVSSRAYEIEINKIQKDIKIEMTSCPTLVALVEEGLNQHPLLPEAFKYYLEKFKIQPDILILGCTHFPFFKETFSELYPEIKLIDSSISLSEDLKTQLELDCSTNKDAQIKILLSDEAQNFKSFVKKIFSENIDIEKVDIK